MKYGLPFALTAVLMTGIAQQALAQEPVAAEQIVNYPAAFFSRYQPNNALDMVRQIPGFLIDDGGGKRGFGAALGNILINERRPSAKQDSPSAILTRIPASSVDYIELIRGQVRGIDLQGQTVVANIVLRQDLPVTVRWEAFIRENFKHGLAPGGSLSLSHRIGDIEYNLGADARLTNFGDGGPVDVFDGDGNLVEERFEDDGGPGLDGFDINSYLNAATWIGESFVQLNTKIGAVVRDELLQTAITPYTPGDEPSSEVIDTERRDLSFALGLDAERLLGQDLIGKGIFLLYLLDQYPSTGRRQFNQDGDMTRMRVVDTDTFSLETIGRIELTWAGWENHDIQLNLEGAYNSLDNELLQTDHANGAVTVIDVPGSDSKVTEARGDFVLRDTWDLDPFSVEYGLGAEVSRISQTGDAELERDFFFLKPYMNLSWSPSRREQTRFRLAREVSQLNFNDFVSATVFRDNDLALGNPNLRPETTWQMEVSHERRFGELGVVTLSLFHDWISDVEDLLPLSDTFEAPGNIGDGKRWGVDVETTLPLAGVGLHSARLDLRGRWQDSSVTDPVTGEKRVLSGAGGIDPGLSFDNENTWSYTVAFRQDLEQSRLSWGVDIGDQDDRPRFKVNEFDSRDEGVSLNAFVETSRWFGIKMRLDAINLLNYKETRERVFYTGRRGLSPVDIREIEDFTNGARVTLTLSGSF